MKDHYFFFDGDGMPIAVFYTEFSWQAVNLFVKLYRRPWNKSLQMGITICKESDVPVSRWDEIHRKYIARIEPKKAPPPVIVKPVTMIKNRKPDEYQSSGLECAKYMSRM